MTDQLRITILGCGSSGGVPRLGGQWGNCDPLEPRNRRSRCSILVEKWRGEAVTRVLIDTSPDMRAQLLDAEVALLDGAVFTHAHADHLHGIDDLRMVYFNRGSRLPVWADAVTADVLMTRFEYLFVQPQGSLYHPILDLNPINGDFRVPGPGGEIVLRPIRVQHGRIEALGFRIGGVVYLPDVSEIPEEVWPELENLDVWIVDALRRKPHPTHAHLSRTLEWIDRAQPRRAVITNMHNDLDYATLLEETPANVTPAHDGLVLETPL